MELLSEQEHVLQQEDFAANQAYAPIKPRGHHVCQLLSAQLPADRLSELLTAPAQTTPAVSQQPLNPLPLPQPAPEHANHLVYVQNRGGQFHKLVIVGL